MKLSIFAILVISTNAFTTAPSCFVNYRSVMVTTTARHVILSDAETKAILSAAEECADSECSVEDVSSLIADLKAQQKVLNNRLEKVMNMIAHLQHVNEKEERKTDEVRAFVKDLLSVFSHSKPMGIATGLDAFDGPFDAYDALPPKPWTAPKK